MFDCFVRLGQLFVFPSGEYGMVWRGIPVLQKQPVRMMILSLSAIL